MFRSAVAKLARQRHRMAAPVRAQRVSWQLHRLTSAAEGATVQDGNSESTSSEEPAIWPWILIGVGALCCCLMGQWLLAAIVHLFL